MKDLKETEQQLATVSDTFCVAPWHQVTLHLSGGVTHSCCRVVAHAIPKNDLKANPSILHNTPQKKQLRRALLEGQRPKECNYCWQAERMGQIADRVIRSSESWADGKIEEIKAMPWDVDAIPSYVELSFATTCNLKCSYCNPYVSSKWREESLQYGAYPVSTAHGHLAEGGQSHILQREHNPYVEAFWDWWPQLYPHLKVLRVTGGEPLLTKHTFRLLDEISKQPRLDLEVAVNSNLCVSDALISKLIDAIRLLDGQIQNFIVFTSVDGFGAQAEYGRYGMSYDQVMRNTRRVLDETSAAISFMVTFNALSVTSFPRFLSDVLALKQQYGGRVQFDTPTLTEPPFQSVSVLTSDYSAYLDTSIAFMQMHETGYHGFNELEIGRMRRIKAVLLASLPEPDLTRYRRDFFLFMQEHDKRRGTDFLATFPEMTPFYELCRSLV